jgi:hypothetical protein
MALSRPALAEDDRRGKMLKGQYGLLGRRAFRLQSGEVRTISTVEVEQGSGAEARWMAQGTCWDMNPATSSFRATASVWRRRSGSARSAR